jgi:hypothetical protein
MRNSFSPFLKISNSLNIHSPSEDIFLLLIKRIKINNYNVLKKRFYPAPEINARYLFLNSIHYTVN